MVFTAERVRCFESGFDERYQSICLIVNNPRLDWFLDSTGLESHRYAKTYLDCFGLYHGTWALDWKEQQFIYNLHLSHHL